MGDRIISPSYHHLRRIFGGLSLLLIPYYFSKYILLDDSFDLDTFGANPENFHNGSFHVVLVLMIALPITYTNTKEISLQNTYPQIRLEEWGRFDIIMNYISWGVYLFGYEFLFRGYLIFPVEKYQSIYYAIGLNVILYVMAHFDKPRKEIIACVPIGIIYCVLAIKVEKRNNETSENIQARR